MPRLHAMFDKRLCAAMRIEGVVRRQNSSPQKQTDNLSGGPEPTSILNMAVLPFFLKLGERYWPHFPYILYGRVGNALRHKNCLRQASRHWAAFSD